MNPWIVSASFPAENLDVHTHSVLLIWELLLQKQLVFIREKHNIVLFFLACLTYEILSFLMYE